MSEMGERFSKMEQMRLMAHALCDEEKPEEERFGERNAEVTIMHWYDPDDHLYCELQRHVDDIGTDFILYITDPDETDRREALGEEPEIVEWYEILYDQPNILITRDKEGEETGRFVGSSAAHDRVYRLLDRSDVRQDLLEKRVSIDDAFRHVVGRYALGDDAM